MSTPTDTPQLPQISDALRNQLYTELAAINNHLAMYGDKSVYALQPDPNRAEKPSILVNRRKTAPSYCLWFCNLHNDMELVAPASHPADLLYRLCEIKATLYRHYPAPKEPK